MEEKNERTDTRRNLLLVSMPETIARRKKNMHKCKKRYKEAKIRWKMQT